MPKHGRPLSHKTIGHVPFLRAPFPVATFEDVHPLYLSLGPSWFLCYFFPDFSRSLLSLNQSYIQYFFLLLVSLLPGIVAAYDQRALLPFLVCPSLKGTDDQ